MLLAPALLALVLVPLPAAPPLDADSLPREGDPTPVTLPIHADTGHIVHRVFLEGQGPFWAMLDTGNQQTVIFERVARELGLETLEHGEMGGAGSGTIPVRRASDVTVTLRGEGASLSFEEPLVVVLPDAAALPEENGRRIDAILGGSLIREFATSIDYPAETLTFHEPGAYEPGPDARILEIALAEGFPYFEGSVTPVLRGEARPAIRGRFHLDLGAPFGVQLDHVAAQPAGLLDGDDPERRLLGQIMGIDGELMDLYALPAKDVVMGGLELDDDEVLLLPVQGGGPPIEGLIGTVGSGSFRDGVVTLEYGRGRMVVEPSRAGE